MALATLRYNGIYRVMANSKINAIKPADVGSIVRKPLNRELVG